MTTPETDVAALSYEQALAELESLIVRLEGGAVDLDDAIRCYERGSRLAQRCGELLDRTEAAVTQLVVGAQGQLQERPFSPEPPARGDTAAGGATPPARPAPVRARPVPGAGAPAGPRNDPGLFPGLEPAPRPPAGGADEGPEPAGFDADDIPF